MISKIIKKILNKEKPSIRDAKYFLTVNDSCSILNIKEEKVLQKESLQEFHII